MVPVVVILTNLGLLVAAAGWHCGARRPLGRASLPNVSYSTEATSTQPSWLVLPTYLYKKDWVTLGKSWSLEHPLAVVSRRGIYIKNLYQRSLSGRSKCLNISSRSYWFIDFFNARTTSLLFINAKKSTRKRSSYFTLNNTFSNYVTASRSKKHSYVFFFLLSTILLLCGRTKY